jgi:signal-transduction protein with cAMP-binding, CBS, and nucleotidyltransferase domain
MMLRLSGFVERVNNHVTRPALTLQPETSCADVVEAMRAAGDSHAFVTAPDGALLGIVTEHDITRRVAFQVAKERPVSEVMSAPVHSVKEHEFLYLAIARMRRLRVRHMPVIDGRGRVSGVVELETALAVVAAQTLDQIDHLAHEGSLEGMRHTKAAQARLARELLDDAVPAPEILALLSEINADLHRRVVDLTVKQMCAGEAGGPPANFEIIVMGSGGRMESLLYPDQDNGFIIDDYPDAEHTKTDGWFIALADRTVEGLDSVGFPRCRGGVMATNPLWRKRISEWCDQVELWLGKSSGLVLRLCDIFFDFHCVYGSGTLSRRLREQITRLAPQQFFLRELYKLDEVHGPALGLFGRLKTDPLKGPGQGKVNLKLTGTLPLVGAIRIFALRERIPEVSTLARIDALGRGGVLDDDEVDYLAGGFKHITGLLLRQQLADFEAGRPVGNHMPLDSMTRRDKDMLADVFRAIRRLRSRLRAELTAEVF